MRYLFIFTCFLAGALISAQAPFTVKEYSGTARTNEPVTCGIAFKKGECQTLSSLSLLRGGSSVPAQFSPLVKFEDGSYQWVLVDFIDDFAANEEKSYSVTTNSGVAALPANPLSLTGIGKRVIIDNGIIRLSIDTASFSGIDSLDYNGMPLIGGKTGGLVFQDKAYGNIWLKNGEVTKAGVVYSGTSRITFRVEGKFYSDTCGGVGFSYMVTAYAGSPRLRIEIQIRNSLNSQYGRMAKIGGATVRFPLAFTPSQNVSFDTSITIWARGMTNEGIGRNALKSARYGAAYQNSSAGIAVGDQWAGGLYPFWLNSSRIDSGMLEIDLIRADSVCEACSSSAPEGKVWGCPGYQYDSTLANRDTVYKLQDMSVKNSEFWLECYPGGITSGSLKNYVRKWRSRMVGRLDPVYLSSTMALSAGKFGTLEDEIASYNKQGWTFSESKKPVSLPNPYANRMYTDVHGSTEIDAAESFLLQWVRTGQRGFFDEGEAWSRFHKTHYAFRTHGFMHNGASTIWKTGETRKVLVNGSTSYSWYGSRVDAGTWVGCHFYGAGLCDYYCLTGDIDAFEGAIDLGETARLASRGVDTTKAIKAGIGREDTRMLDVLTRIYEITRDPFWKDVVKFRARWLLKSERNDPFLIRKTGVGTWHSWWTGVNNYKGLPDSLKQYMITNKITIRDSLAGAWLAKDGKIISNIYTGANWTSANMPRGMERYYKLTGDDDALDLLTGFAQYLSLFLSRRCDFIPYDGPFLNFPEPGMTYTGANSSSTAWEWDPAHDTCKFTYGTAANSCPMHEGDYSMQLAGACAIGYRYSGFPYLKRSALRLWNRGSKRDYHSTSFAAPEKTVRTFTYVSAPNIDACVQVEDLFVEDVNRMDTVPPEAIANLSVVRAAGDSGLYFNWTAPAGAATYQLKYFKGKSIVDYADYLPGSREDNNKRVTPDTSKVPWWFARNAVGEPLPTGAGNIENYYLRGSFPSNEVWYAAVCSRDSAGNLSALSNVVRIDNSIAVEKLVGSEPFKMNVSPNPFNPALSIILSGLEKKGGIIKISIYDMRGRKIREFNEKFIANRHSVIWNGKDVTDRVVASGLYTIRIECGIRVLTTTAMLMK